MDEHQAIQEQSDERHSARLICTANHGFAPYAQEELRRLFGSLKSTVLVPGEVFVLTLGTALEDAVRRIIGQQPIFLRHLFPVHLEVGAEDAEQAVREVAAYLVKRGMLASSRMSVQVRKTEGTSWTESSGALRDRLMEELAPLEVEFTVHEPDWVISLFAGKETWYLGVSKPDENLSDWNGGAIRFQREEGQISRAKFKLLEAEKQFSIPFSSFGRALDIGAAPGGWTSFLLERGIQVTAVDPAKMHETLIHRPGLRFIQKNAAEVKFKEHEFDLIVCDMSWSPKQMARLVTGLLYSLVPGGTAVITVKLLTKKPMALIKEITGMFEESRMQIQGAKQLFHNRDEITLYMIKY